MKNKWLLLSIIPLIISGCFTKKDTSGSSSQPTSSSSTSTSSSEPSSSEGDERFNMYDFDITNLLETKNLKKCLEDDFIFDEYGYYSGTLESRIEEPSHTANSLQDISDIYDYCAFYKIPSVTITLNYSHVGTTNEQEFNTAYWNSIMLPGIVGITKTLNGNECTVNFAYSDYANSFSSVRPKQFYDHVYTVVPYLYSGTKITTIPYNGTGSTIDVWNSDQLIYALVHKHNVNIISGSPAEVIYNKAVSILKKIIYNEMTEQERLLAIECYLDSVSIYDNNSDSYASFTSDSHASNTEEIASLTTAFYAEGPLLHGASVCYGYARAQGLLALLLGFDVVLTHGFMDLFESKNRTDALQTIHEVGYDYIYYNAHGINLVKVDGKYGICDPTYRYGNILSWNTQTKIEIRREPAVLMSESNWREKYYYADEVGLTIYQDQLVTSSFDGRTALHFENGMDMYCGSTLSGFQTALNNVVATIDAYKAQESITDAQLYAFQFYPFLANDSQKETADQYIFNTVYSLRDQGMESDLFYYYAREYANSEGYTLFVKR